MCVFSSSYKSYARVCRIKVFAPTKYYELSSQHTEIAKRRRRRRRHRFVQRISYTYRNVCISVGKSACTRTYRVYIIHSQRLYSIPSIYDLCEYTILYYMSSTWPDRFDFKHARVLWWFSKINTYITPFRTYATSQQRPNGFLFVYRVVHISRTIHIYVHMFEIVQKPPPPQQKISKIKNTIYHIQVETPQNGKTNSVVRMYGIIFTITILDLKIIVRIPFACARNEGPGAPLFQSSCTTDDYCAGRVVLCGCVVLCVALRHSDVTPSA